jgi:BNR/Asp-box repeat protein
MPEFHDQYDTAAVSDRISQPPFAELVHRGRRRAHRTRTIRLAGVAVVAALAATPLLTLPSQDGPGTPAASPPGLEPGLWFVTFLDVDHGIATNWDQPTCTFSLFVTDDGGSTWSEPRALPGFPGRERIEAERYCLIPDVTQVAPDTLVVPVDSRIEHEYVSMSMDPPASSYVSRDAGRTWQEYELETRTADTVPDGVIPSTHCETRFQPGEYEPPEGGWCTGAPQLSWYDSQTGHLMVLRNNPQVELLYTPEIGVDGSIWVGGHDAGGHPHISVSEDRGRTWRDVSPPPAQDVDAGAAISAAVSAWDSDTAYFHPMTEIGGSTTPSEFYRTTDGGETWQPLPAAQQFEDIAGVGVARDGTLVVSDLRDPESDTDGVVYRSGDGGETFELVDPLGLLPMQVSGGYYGDTYDFTEQHVIRAVSEDGLTWREFDLPEFDLPR